MKYLCDAKGEACRFADKSGLAMTVFYHADTGMMFCDAHKAWVARMPRTEFFVTYLPSNYFTPI